MEVRFGLQDVLKTKWSQHGLTMSLCSYSCSRRFTRASATLSSGLRRTMPSAKRMKSGTSNYCNPGVEDFWLMIMMMNQDYDNMIIIMMMNYHWWLWWKWSGLFSGQTSLTISSSKNCLHDTQGRQTFPLSWSSTWSSLSSWSLLPSSSPSLSPGKM